MASDGKTLVSADGLRTYRPPSFKPNLGKIQANFEQKVVSGGQPISNGHLDIMMIVTAKVRGIYTSSMDELEPYAPTDPESFTILVRVLVGPREGKGEESFDLNVCSTRWLEEHIEHEGFVLGIHRLFVKTYDPVEIKKFITRTIERFSGATWREVAGKIGRLAYWEFEEYKPSERT